MDEFRQEVMRVMDEAWELRDNPSEEPAMEGRGEETAPVETAEQDEMPMESPAVGDEPVDEVSATAAEPEAVGEMPDLPEKDAEPESEPELKDADPEPLGDMQEPAEFATEELSSAEPGDFEPESVPGPEPAVDPEPVGVDGYVAADDPQVDVGDYPDPAESDVSLPDMMEQSNSERSALQSSENVTVNVSMPEDLPMQLQEAVLPHISQMRTQLMGQFEDMLMEGMRGLDRRSSL